MSTTYQEVADRVSGILVNASIYVAAQIPRLVHSAQLFAERKHGFLAMRGDWMVKTQLGVYETAPGPGTVVSALGPLADTAGRCFLRSRKEKPYWIEFPTLPSFTASTQFVRFENTVAADGRIKWTLGSGSGTSFTARGFRPGQHVRVTNFGSQTGSEWIDGLPFVVESISSDGWTMTLRTPDEGRTVGTILYATLKVEAVWDTPTVTHPMEWLAPNDVQRFYGSAQSGADKPRHLAHAAADENGYPRFLCYPRNDTETFHVAIPAEFHLGPSLTEPANQATSSWFTNHASEYLEAYAAGEAYMLEEDDAQSKKWMDRALARLRELIREDRRNRVHGDTLRMAPSGPYQGGAQRTPGW